MFQLCRHKPQHILSPFQEPGPRSIVHVRLCLVEALLVTVSDLSLRTPYARRTKASCWLPLPSPVCGFTKQAQKNFKYACNVLFSSLDWEPTAKTVMRNTPKMPTAKTTKLKGSRGKKLERANMMAAQKPESSKDKSIQRKRKQKPCEKTREGLKR